MDLGVVLLAYRLEVERVGLQREPGSDGMPIEIADDKLEELVRQHFDLRPRGIIEMLDLLRPIYRKTAAYGHFGREEPEFSWERTDKAQALAADAAVKSRAVG